MLDLAASTDPAGPPIATENRQRYQEHGARIQRRAAERAALLASRKQLARAASDPQ
jgi:hypothetical protein